MPSNRPGPNWVAARRDLATSENHVNPEGRRLANQATTRNKETRRVAYWQVAGAKPPIWRQPFKSELG